MFSKVAVLVLALAVVASGNPAAGKPWSWKSRRPLVDAKMDASNARIVGGSEATPHSFPHQAALFIDNMYFCGGSLISTEWVMTAAHCMDGADFVDVVLGAHNIREEEPTQITVRSTDHFIHENYNSFTIQNDIAMIHLPSPVSLDANIATVALPSSDPAVGTVYTPSGWGKPSDSAGGISDILRNVDVPSITTEECADYYGSIVTDKMLCIDSTGGKGTCNGDSGGPLNYMGTTHGITSFGASAGCESGHPDSFARVTSYLDWIQEKTGVTPA